MDMPYAAYELGKPYDEMFSRDGKVRLPYAGLDARISTLPLEELTRRQQACEQSFLHQGITFTVYNDNKATERIIPTDLLPRIVTAKEWDRIERGLTQRIHALNLFLRDIYTDGRVLKDGVLPRGMIYGSKHNRREMRGLPVPHGAYVNICGSDLIRNEAGDFVVLEDNLRVPSGVSYMLANRDVARRAFPGVFRAMGQRGDHRGSRTQHVEDHAGCRGKIALRQDRNLRGTEGDVDRHRADISAAIPTAASKCPAVQVFRA
jgi:uncharacterized circularly permuted ATP-grasp superfamily protein